MGRDKKKSVCKILVLGNGTFAGQIVAEMIASVYHE
jgi:hypothetical protein